MFIDLPPTYYIAQVYNCDVYGGGDYNECPTTTSPGSTGSGTTTSTPGGSADSNTTDSMNPDGAATTDSTTQGDTGNTTSDTTNTGQPTASQESSPASAIAGTSWAVLIPVILLVAVAIAGLIWLFKRRRNNNLPPPNTPYNPTPGQF